MIVGVISDTHDVLANTAAVFELFAAHNVETVIHCGDWKSPATVVALQALAERYAMVLHGVIGNNDHDVAAFKALGLHEGVFRFTLDDKKCAAYHGHHAPTLRALKLESNDVVFLGHTHKPKIETLNGQLMINPGSTAFAIPRSKTWLASVATYNTETHNAELHYLG